MVKALALASLILIASCAHRPVGDFCTTNEAIRLPKIAIAMLSYEEQKKVLAHNLKGARLCGWKP